MQAHPGNQPDAPKAVVHAGEGKSPVSRGTAVPELVVDAGKAVHIVDADGRGILASTSEPKEHVLWAPGRAHQLVLKWDLGSIYRMRLCDAQGKLVLDLSKEYDPWPRGDVPNWSPDGRLLAFASQKSGRLQVHVLDLSTGKATQRTRHPEGASLPRFLPDGRIAYQAWGPDTGKKIRYHNLVLLDGEQETVLLEKVPLTGFAFSPDGKHLAYGSIDNLGRLVVRDLGTGKETAYTLQGEPEESLQGKGAEHISWRPDGQLVACMFRFVGGRALGPGQKWEDFVMFGDREVFCFPLEGKGRFVTIPKSDPHLLYWRAREAGK
jgi:WD40 repeat protein